MEKYIIMKKVNKFKLLAAGLLIGVAYWIGKFFPASHFIILSRGVFTKALQFANLIGPLFALAAFIPVLTFIAWLFLPKQEK